MTDPFPQTATWAPLPDGPFVIAHRGNGGSSTENTAGACQQAADLGADWVEIDVCATADERLVLAHSQFHDGTPVWQQRTDDLPHEQFTEDFPFPADVGVTIDVKPVPGDAGPGAGPSTLDLLAPMLPAIAASHPVLCVCFDPVIVQRLRASGVPTGWLAKQTLSPLGAVITATGLGVDVLCLHGPTTDFTGTPWQHARTVLDGVQVHVWDADPADVPTQAAAGVVGFCGDDARGLVEAVSQVESGV